MRQVARTHARDARMQERRGLRARVVDLWRRDGHEARAPTPNNEAYTSATASARLCFHVEPPGLARVSKGVLGPFEIVEERQRAFQGLPRLGKGYRGLPWVSLDQDPLRASKTFEGFPRASLAPPRFSKGIQVPSKAFQGRSWTVQGLPRMFLHHAVPVAVGSGSVQHRSHDIASLLHTAWPRSSNQSLSLQ